jgi:hypothetical protein
MKYYLLENRAVIGYYLLESIAVIGYYLLESIAVIGYYLLESIAVIGYPTCADDIALLGCKGHELKSLLDIVQYSIGRDLVTINPANRLECPKVKIDKQIQLLICF